MYVYTFITAKKKLRTFKLPVILDSGMHFPPTFITFAERDVCIYVHACVHAESL